MQLLSLAVYYRVTVERQQIFQNCADLTNCAQHEQLGHEHTRTACPADSFAELQASSRRLHTLQTAIAKIHLGLLRQTYNHFCVTSRLKAYTRVLDIFSLRERNIITVIS